jgi:hypothetical protein
LGDARRGAAGPTAPPGSVEASAAIGIGCKRGRQYFYGYIPLQSRIASAVHLAHTAFAELAFDAVRAEGQPGDQH